MAWTAPTQRTTGTLITSAIYNTDIIDDLTFLGVTHAHAGAAGDGATIAAVPANIITYFNGAVASIPSGWTEFTAARGRVIVGVPLSGTVGGTVGTALTDLQDPTHTHAGGSHTHTTAVGRVGGSLKLSDSFGTGAEMTEYANWTGTAGATAVSGYLTNASGTGATGATSATMPYINQPAIYKQ